MAVPKKELELKLFVDKHKNKLLFAEADADFVDCIFSFLSFPLGTIVRLVSKTTQSQPSVTIGCFNTMHQSVQNLNKELFCTFECQDQLLRPRCLLEEEFRRLKINVDDTEPRKYYRGSIHCSDCKHIILMYPIRTRCCICRNTSNKETSLVEFLDSTSGWRKDGVFVTKASKFIATDNLHVMPLIPGTAIGHLFKLGVEDTNVLEERTVKLGLTQLLDLLKWTLASTTPFTDMFLSKESLASKIVLENPPFESKHSLDKAQEISKIEVKVMLRKSNKEVLFVEAKEDFVNILFSFLITPLVELLQIFDGQSCLGSLGGLYKSALALESQYFMSVNEKNILLSPKCSPYFKLKKGHFLSEANQGSFVLEGVAKSIANPKLPRDNPQIGSEGLKFVKGPALFMVMDNLEVKPFLTGSAISVLNGRNCLLRDLEERTVSIGIVEVLSILKACLNSTSAFTNGLFHKLNLKEPKQEIHTDNLVQ